MIVQILDERRQIAVAKKHAVFDKCKPNNRKPSHSDITESILNIGQSTDYQRAMRELRSEVLRKPEAPAHDRVEIVKNRKRKFDQMFAATRRQTGGIVKKGEGIGVELEFYCPIDNERELLKLAGNHQGGDGIAGMRLKYDSSVEASIDICQMREAVLFLRYGSYSRLYKACHALRSAGADVNPSCGLHVHIDCRDCMSSTMMGTRAKRLRAALPWLKRMVPPSRNTGNFSSSTSGRYAPINTESYGVHSTIEVRLHSGTLNPDKVRNWIELVRFLALRVGRGSRPTHLETLEDFLAAPEAPEALKQWVLARTNTFNPVEGTDEEDSESN